MNALISYFLPVNIPSAEQSRAASKASGVHCLKGSLQARRCAALVAEATVEGATSVVIPHGTSVKVVDMFASKGYKVVREKYVDAFPNADRGYGPTMKTISDILSTWHWPQNIVTRG